MSITTPSLSVTAVTAPSGGDHDAKLVDHDAKLVDRSAELRPR
jgi:hypothetical protein